MDETYTCLEYIAAIVIVLFRSKFIIEYGICDIFKSFKTIDKSILMMHEVGYQMQY